MASNDTEQNKKVPKYLPEKIKFNRDSQRTTVHVHLT